MSDSKKYNFDIIFEKIEESKKDNSYPSPTDNQIIEDVNKDIEKLQGFIDAINESQYTIYTRS